LTSDDAEKLCDEADDKYRMMERAWADYDDEPKLVEIVNRPHVPKALSYDLSEFLEALDHGQGGDVSTCKMLTGL